MLWAPSIQEPAYLVSAACPLPNMVSGMCCQYMLNEKLMLWMNEWMNEMQLQQLKTIHNHIGYCLHTEQIVSLQVCTTASQMCGDASDIHEIQIYLKELLKLCIYWVSEY